MKHSNHAFVQGATQGCAVCAKRINDPIHTVKPKWDLYWSPEGGCIAKAVEAADARAAIRKAPQPYRKYLGEIYALPAGTDPAAPPKS